ncbi:WD40-repeat-containing domain protein [Gautieria morchelliformis]|nr:WD40-repeat-containing domain protein [Gautieria morchelliformis]
MTDPTAAAIKTLISNGGVVDNGRLHIVSLVPPTSHLDKAYDMQDGLYDIAWSEIHENQIVTASGDGSIKLWGDLPIRAWHEHTHEVFSVDWLNLDREFFISSSWDSTVKLWTPSRPHSVQMLYAHSACIHQAIFSAHHPATLATCSFDGTMKIFDLLLTLYWNKYRPFNIAMAGVDKNIKIWDCRMVKMGACMHPTSTAEVGGICERELRGHDEYAVHKVQWNMTWSTKPNPPAPSLLHVHDTHTEFVDEGLLASCSWDCKVNVYQV